MTRRHGILTLLATALLAVAPAAGRAQEPMTERLPSLQVFLDCGGECDFDFIRREIPFVSWVVDRTHAHVHVLVTEQDTGGGGEVFTLEFIGRERFDGTRYRLRETTAATAVPDEVRRQLTRALALGLVRFAAETEAADGLEIRYDAPAAAAGEPATPAAPVDDPWNAWVFRIRAGGAFAGESQRKESSLDGRITGDRVTATWKHSFFLDGEWEHDRITLYESISETEVDTTVIRDDRYSYDASAMSVRAIARHWSAGARAAVSAESRLNQDLTVAVGPALEYNLFPYEQSDRRQLTFVYSAGVRYVDYTEMTLFGKRSETLPGHQLSIDYDATEPWGGGRLGLDLSQYLHDPSKYSAELGGFFRVRILRGLDFEAGGSVEWIRDQLFLPMEGESTEDVLLQRRQLATNYEYGVHLGLSYRFGSAFNNIVNPRLDGYGNFF